MKLCKSCCFVVAPSLTVSVHCRGEPEEPAGFGYYGRRLTFEHKAEDVSEQQRIVKAGGFITRGRYYFASDVIDCLLDLDFMIFICLCLRVLGILAVSRSFGDHGMKDFVTAE